jgi:hypothetical protein
MVADAGHGGNPRVDPTDRSRDLEEADDARPNC